MATTDEKVTQGHPHGYGDIAAVGYSKRLTVLSALLCTIGGIVYGYGIGFVPIYTTFNTFNTDCTKLLSETACRSVEHANCVWAARTTTNDHGSTGGSGNGSSSTAAPFACLFTDYMTVHCSNYTARQDCELATSCVWDYAKNRCAHTPDWSAAKTGLFASAMIIGGMFGAMGVGPLLDRFGRKAVIYLTVVVALVTCVLANVARLIGSYPLLILERILMGAVTGGLTVACPLYAEEMTPPSIRHVMVVTFQLGTTFGTFLVSLLGLAWAPTDFSAPMHMELRFQGLNGVQWLVCMLMGPVAFIIPESDVWLAQRRHQQLEDEAERSPLVDPSSGGTAASLQTIDNGATLSTLSTPSSVVNTSSAPGPSDDPSEPFSPATNQHVKAVTGEQKEQRLCLIIFVSLMLSASQQFTGINAVMNYAPNIMQAAGMRPLLGNFVVMAWNFVASFGAIPAASKISPRKLYLGGTLIASIACLVNGLPVYPGLLSFLGETARHVIAALGIMIFIAAFQIAMGPVFYMLAVEIFPSKWRSMGCAFTNMAQFILNILVNLFFPVLVVAMSGGPSGNQDEGLGLMFIFFGVSGLLTLPPMWKWLFPAPDAHHHQ